MEKNESDKFAMKIKIDTKQWFMLSINHVTDRNQSIKNGNNPILFNRVNWFCTKSMIVIGNDITISDSLTERMTVVNQHNEI